MAAHSTWPIPVSDYWTLQEPQVPRMEAGQDGVKQGYAMGPGVIVRSSDREKLGYNGHNSE
jgi:hypothetical protein